MKSSNRTDLNLLLIDGNSMLNRAFYGQGSRGMSLSAPDGTPTGGLHTFLLIFIKALQEIKPTHLLVCFDTSAPTFRHKKYDSYKAGRSAMPEDLKIQFPLLKEFFDLSGIARLEIKGFEADDLLGTYAKIAEDGGGSCSILTGDKDSFQLINEKTHVIMPPFRSGTAPYKVYDIELFKQRYGLMPSQFVDVKALMGDPSDNIPGVPGIGEKRALALISSYESLDGVYANLDKLKGKMLESLIENKAQAYMCQKLSEIKKDVPLPEGWENIDNLEIKIGNTGGKAAEFLMKLNLKQVLSKFKFENTAEGVSALAEKDNTEIQINETDYESFCTGLSDMLRENKDKEGLLIYVLSCAAKAEKSLKKAAPLLSRGAYLGATFLCTENSKDKNKKLNAVTCLCPDEENLRQRAADIVLESGKTVLCYRSKQLFREGVLSRGQKCLDVETLAYLSSEVGETKDFLSLVSSAAGFAPAEEDLDEKDLLNLQLQKLPPLLSLLSPGKLPANTRKLAYEIDFPLSEVLAFMERRGIFVNPETLDKIHQDFEKKSLELENRIKTYAGKDFNVSSPKQLSEVLFDDLKLPSGKKLSSGAYSTAQSELERLEGTHPIIEEIIKYRFYSKIDSTFASGLKHFISEEDGRIHSDFIQNYTSTGRLSSRNPNLQNIPVRRDEGREIRKAFEAAEGHLLIDADYSQIELRLLAHLSGDEGMREAFTEGKDIHRITASQIFALPESEISPKQRAVGKTINFSIIYGISAYSLSQDLKISVGAAKRYIDAYNETYPMVRKYLDSLVKSAREKGYVETIFGRRRYIKEITSSNYNLRQFGERAAMNAPIQGTAADLIRLAMVRADRMLREEGLSAFLVSQVHDELIVEVREDQAEEAANLVKKAMEEAYEFDVPIKADLAVAKNWLDAKS